MVRILLRALVLLVAAALATAALLYVDYQRTLDRPLAVSEAVPLQVARGTSYDRLVRTLHEQGLVERPHWLRLWGRLHSDARRIQAGEYLLEPGMTLPALVERMVAGEVVLYGFTIIEGWTFAQMMAALHSHPVIEPTLQGLDHEQLLVRLGIEASHPEGLFYPDTYRFPRGTRDVDFLRRAYRAMQVRLEQEWERRAEGLPIKTPYEALILASIIERETGAASERGKVAGVFVRRLQIGMRLQTDPTVIYGVGEGFEGRLRTRHLRTDTPYNTYTRFGLPPTPIAMPGGASIRAALNPEDGRELYFVSRGDGSHHFSETLQEHNRAVRKYILGQGD
jgi:UPF0755 protein